jgi:hypothetical protein
MLDVGQFADVYLRGRVAAQRVGDDFPRRRARTKHVLEEAFSGGMSRRAPEVTRQYRASSTRRENSNAPRN